MERVYFVGKVGKVFGSLVVLWSCRLPQVGGEVGVGGGKLLEATQVGGEIDVGDYRVL
jgi:hypothetical protein